MDGIILLDKPYNWTSYFTMLNIKNIFNINKIGYSGNLDKLSTGILPILINKGTKYSKYFNDLNKVYDVILYLGIKTYSYDGDSKILKKNNSNKIEFFNIENIINRINNKNIIQITPIYSNFKYLGKKIKDIYINKNIKINIPRIVTIYNIKIVFFRKNFLKLIINCSKGTYIRAIVNYIGDQLNCGAYVFSLRRIFINSFNDKNLLNFNTIYNFFKKDYLKIKKEDFLKKYFLKKNNLQKKNILLYNI